MAMPVIQSGLRQRVDVQSLLSPDLPGLQVLRVGNRVGESPVWDDGQEALMWIDIRQQQLLALRPADDSLQRWHLDALPGAIGLASSGELVMTLGRQVVMVDPQRQRVTVLAEMPEEPQTNRLNDGKVSPSGKWFVFGSMDDRPPPRSATGALYCMDSRGHVRRIADGLAVANGIAWSRGADRLYYSDSDAGRIFCAPWDEETGQLGRACLFATSLEAEGRPDGALVTARDEYLSAGVSAGCLNRFDRHGRLLQRLMLPCRAPTMPCHGGAALRTLYVTSLVRPGWTTSQTPDHDGDLFRFDVAEVGLPAPRFEV